MEKDIHQRHQGINKWDALRGIKWHGHEELWRKHLKGETEHGVKVTMPIQISEVKRVLMSTHKMSKAGLKVVHDGPQSFFFEKSTGILTPLRYE